MGYTLRIGEARLEPADDPEYPSVAVTVDRVVLPDAPIFPGEASPTQSNERWPSYLGWERFCADTGLSDLFYGPLSEPRSYTHTGEPRREREHGLLCDHPGAAQITPNHLAIVKAARKAREQNGKKPGWSEDEGADDGTLDGDLARLIWLEWWMQWALNNCTIPTFFNS